jgi:hypothetical protein
MDTGRAGLPDRFALGVGVSVLRLGGVAGKFLKRKVEFNPWGHQPSATPGCGQLQGQLRFTKQVTMHNTCTTNSRS